MYQKTKQREVNSMHLSNEMKNPSTQQRSSRRQSNKNWSKLNRSIHLLAIVFWVCMSGTSYGQLIITGTEVWSDIPLDMTLSTVQVTEAETNGIIIKSGAQLTVYHSNAGFSINGDLVVNPGGQLIVESGMTSSCVLCVNADAYENGTCTVTSGAELRINGGNLIVTGTMNIGQGGKVNTINGNFTLERIGTGAGAIIYVGGGSLGGSGALNVSNSGSTVIKDFSAIAVENGILNLLQTTMSNSGYIQGKNSSVNIAGDASLTDSEIYCYQNSYLNFFENVTLDNTSEINVRSGTKLDFMAINSGIISIGGLLDLNNGMMKCKSIGIGGNLNLSNNSECEVSNYSTLDISGKVNSSSSKFLMGINSEITVLGELICESTFFNPKGVNNTWLGIRSRNSNRIISTQWDTPPVIGSDGNCTVEEWAGELAFTGLVELRNSYITNANTGIHSNSQSNVFSGGLVVRVRNCSFENCYKGIVIDGFSIWDLTDFNNPIPLDQPNASYIMTTNFITNDEFKNNGFLQQGMVGIELDRLKHSGVNIGGCAFINNMTTQELDNERGTGIKVFESSITLARDGDKCCGDLENGECPDNCFDNPLQTPRENEFTNLSFGISADQSSNLEFKTALRFSKFTDCYRSIDMNNVATSAINYNDFTLTQSNYASFFANPNPTDRYFINLTESGGYTIAENVMEANLNALPDQMTYIQTTNTIKLPELNSKIKMNTFTNNAKGLATGILLLDKSRGNDITCNTFEKLTTDISVQNNLTPKHEHLSTIPKDNSIYSNNTYSDPLLNTNFVINVTSNAPVDVYFENAFLKDPEIAGSVQKEEKLDGPVCSFDCNDNENTETASVKSIGSFKGNLWIYEIDNNTIAVGASKNESFDMCVYSMFGQCGVQLENVFPRTPLDVSSLASGIYFLSLKNSEGIETTLKFIKK